MTREQLEHIIRACAETTGQYEFVVVGSQSILGSVPEPPAVLAVSMEVDIYPRQAPELADEIEGAIGEGSRFHELHGYYAEGVGPRTAILPAEWQRRVCRVQNANTNDRVAYCLDPVDLFLSKAAAGREKDREFCTALLAYGYVKLERALELLPTMPIPDDEMRTLRTRIRRWAGSLRAAGLDADDRL